MPFVHVGRPRHSRRVLRMRGMGDPPTDVIQDPSTGIYYDLSGNVVTPVDTTVSIPVFGQPPGSGPVSLPGSSAGLTPQQIIAAFNQAAAGAINIFKQTQAPGLIAGTQAIYNPATGQYYNPSTGQVVNPTGATIATSLATSPNLLLIGGVVIAGVVLVSMLGRKN